MVRLKWSRRCLDAMLSFDIDTISRSNVGVLVMRLIDTLTFDVVVAVAMGLTRMSATLTPGHVSQATKPGKSA